MNLFHPAKRPPWDELLIGLLIVGYLAMGRSFAYLGIKPIYVGEVAFAALACFRFGPMIGRWLHALVAESPLKLFAWAAYAWLVYGVIHLICGLTVSQYPAITLQDFVVHVYPLFTFAGIYVGLRNPQFLPRVLKLVTWVVCTYGLAFVLVLNRYAENDPETNQPSLFGFPGGGASVAILGMLCFQPQLAAVWLPMLLCAFVMLAMQMRAEWLSFTAAVTLWAGLSRRFRQLATAVSIMAALLIVGYITDVRLPAASWRASELSVRGLVSRALSVVDERAGAKFYDQADDFAGSVTWRSGWWRAIWREVSASPQRMFLGLGYGYPLWDLHPEGLEQPLRTPHSVVFFTLGYTGLLGLAIFYCLEFSLGALLYRAYRRTGELFGLCLWCEMMVWCPNDTFLDTPFGSIPFHLMLGMAAAAALRAPATHAVAAPAATMRPRGAIFQESKA